MIEVELPDGRVVEFPAGMSRDDIREALRKLEGGGPTVIATTPDGGRFVRDSAGRVSFASPGYSTNDPATVERLMGGEGVREVVQSNTDQLTIGQNPVAARFNEFNRGTPFIGSRLDEAVGLVSPQARDAMRQTTDAMQRENPGQTAALNVAGGVATSVPLAVAGAPVAMGAMRGMAGAFPGAASAMQAMTAAPLGKAIVGGVSGGLLGAAEGGVYGSGEGEGEERAGNAATGALVGGLLGGGMGAALPLAGGLVQSIIRRWRGEDVGAIAQNFNVSRDAAKVLKTAFENNDTAAVDRILRAGSEATLADAGRSGQALLDGAAQMGGRPLNIVDSAVSARAARSMPALKGALDDTLGPPRGPRAAAREISAQSAPARGEAYSAFYNTPIDYASPEGREIEGLLNRMSPQRVQQAVDIANERMLWEGSNSAQIMLNIGDDGAVSFREMPGSRSLDELKRALDQIARNSEDTFGRTLDPLPGQQARAVRDATVAATGGPEGTYARALQVGGDKIEMDRGLTLGLQMLRDTSKTTREIVAEDLAGMSADARQMVRLGLRSHIEETLGAVKMIASDPDAMEARQAMQALRMLTSDNAKAKLRALLGADDFARLMPQLDEAIATQGAVASVAQKSPTAIRLAVQGQVDDIIAPGVVGRGARGQPLNAMKSLVQELMNTTPGADAARKEQIWSEIATVLSERRGNRSAEVALQFINDAIAGNPMTEAQARLVANQYLLGTGSAATVGGSRYLGTAQ